MGNLNLKPYTLPLRQRNPGFSEEELYQTARLIVAALNARIHTVEWTPALFGNEVMNITMHNNWCAPARCLLAGKAAACKLRFCLLRQPEPTTQHCDAACNAFEHGLANEWF